MAVRIFSYGGKTVWMLISGFIIAAIASVTLLTKTAELRYQRDVNRMVYNDNLGVLNEVKAKLGMTGDSLRALLNETAAEAIPTGDGVLTTQNGEVVKRYNNGSTVSLGGGVEGKEIVVNGNIVVPPYGTTARRYMGVLGTRRLELGDGYGIHGTDHPETIGQSVSHGCVRMRNADIERLYPMVAIGTPVYIY